MSIGIRRHQKMLSLSPCGKGRTFSIATLLLMKTHEPAPGPVRKAMTRPQGSLPTPLAMTGGTTEVALAAIAPSPDEAGAFGHYP